MRQLRISIGIILFLVSFAIQLKSQPYSSRDLRETNAFISFVKKDMFKIDDCTIRNKFSKVEHSVLFTLPAFKKEWLVSGRQFFKKKELRKIFNQLRDKTGGAEIKISNNCDCNNAIWALDFSALNELKYNIQHYLYSDANVIDIYNLKKLKVDTIAQWHRNIKIVSNDIKKYNKLITKIQQRIQESIYANRVKFSKPIFLRNYRLCVFSYSNGNESLGHIMIFKKKNKQWYKYKDLISYPLETVY